MSVAVLLAIDSTGSMRWVHKELCQNIGSIIQQFEEEGVSVKFSLVGFRDYQSNPADWIESIDFDLTGEEDSEKYANWLSNLKAKGGGGNKAESSMAGVVYGITNFEWPDVKRKVVAVFTDDFAHMPDFNIRTWDESQEILRSNEIQQVHLFVDEKHEDGYDDLDSSEYTVVRHPLVKNDHDGLEKSIRKFVKVSSGGFGGDVELIDRDNPFDIEEEEEEEPLEVEDFDETNIFDEW